MQTTHIYEVAECESTLSPTDRWTGGESQCQVAQCKVSLRRGEYADQDLRQRLSGSSPGFPSYHKGPPVTYALRYQEVTARHAMLLSANNCGLYGIDVVTSTSARSVFRKLKVHHACGMCEEDGGSNTF